MASVIQGGTIMYWGDAQVRSSVQHGGIVIKGKPGELLLPPSEIGFSNFSVKTPLRREL
jgi:formylmethanofuran dehydrogenase subunit C